jgi:hypothetical protein
MSFCLDHSCRVSVTILAKDIYILSILYPKIAKNEYFLSLFGSGILGISKQVLESFSNFKKLSAYCNIACTLARQPCPAALPGSLARQPCPAALPGSLARQPCPAALPGSLARQPCPAALPGSFARQPCTAALPGNLARQPFPAALLTSLAEI